MWMHFKFSQLMLLQRWTIVWTHSTFSSDPTWPWFGSATAAHTIPWCRAYHLNRWNENWLIVHNDFDILTIHRLTFWWIPMSWQAAPRSDMWMRTCTNPMHCSSRFSSPWRMRNRLSSKVRFHTDERVHKVHSRLLAFPSLARHSCRWKPTNAERLLACSWSWLRYPWFHRVRRWTLSRKHDLL